MKKQRTEATSIIEVNRVSFCLLGVRFASILRICYTFVYIRYCIVQPNPHISHNRTCFAGNWHDRVPPQKQQQQQN